MKRIPILFLFLCLCSCAIQQDPEGGPKDELPPKILKTFPENKTTNFEGKDIRIDFNEIVSITELSEQLIVSPLLKHQPEIKSRKKSLFIHINDTLMPNTTYTLNFGSGIADNNEGNKLENYQMVFSTGDVLDSLTLSGHVIRSFDLTTEKGMLVSLYRAYTDSTPYLDKPLYFSKTNENGTFNITNIAPGKYHVVAIDDKDANYLFTPEEMIGFADSEVSAADTGITLSLFTETSGFRFLKGFSEFPGKASLVFSGRADSVKWTWLTDTAKLNLYTQTFSAEHDTITIWYKNTAADSMSLAFDGPSIRDTVILRLFKKAESGKAGRKGTAEFEISPAKNQTTIQHLHLPYYFQANRPVANYDFSHIVFLEDSQAVTPKFTFNDSLHTSFDLNYKWKEKKAYTIFIPPGTFTDIYGVKNDTVKILITSHSESDYGSVTVKAVLMKPGSYVVQLTGIDGHKIIREKSISANATIEMPNLDPAEYRIKIIHDRNSNGKWDTGNLLQKIQPEKVEFYKEPVVVRANWDVELEMNIPLSAE
jgi:uncharacterized protein (DUF2141 family)